MIKRAFLLCSFLLLTGCAHEFVYSPTPRIGNAGKAAEIYVIRDLTGFSTEVPEMANTFWVATYNDTNIARLERGQYTSFYAEAGRDAKIGFKKLVVGWPKDETIFILEPGKKYFIIGSVAKNGLHIDLTRLTEEEATGWIAKGFFVSPVED